MASIAQGNLTDRPWGRTLATLAARAFTGEVWLDSDGKRYGIGFANGAVCAASSPVVNDSAIKLALTANLINPTYASDAQRLLASGYSEIEALCAVAQLSPDHVSRLRRRTIASKVTRTFSLTSGTYTIVAGNTISDEDPVGISLPAIILLGARHHLTTDAVRAALARYGMPLVPSEVDAPALASFAMIEPERLVWQVMSRGAIDETVIEQIATAQHVDPRVPWQVLYAMFSVGFVQPVAMSRTSSAPISAAAASATATVASARPTPDLASPPQLATTPPKTHAAPPLSPSVAKPAPPVVARTPTPPAVARTTTPPMAPPTSSLPAIARTGTPGMVNVPAELRGIVPGVVSPERTSSAMRVPGPTLAGRPRAPTPGKGRERGRSEVEALIQERSALLDADADHFTLLGVSQGASADEVQAAYLKLAVRLHPDRLIAVGLTDEHRQAHRVFARINEAYAILSDTQRRAAYADIVRQGGEKAVRAKQAQAEALTLRVLEAEEQFRLGEMALRRDQIDVALTSFRRALELNPDEADHHAYVGWVTYVAATDKAAAGRDARAFLQQAAKLAPKNPSASLFLGKIARLEGRDTEAIAHFEAALKVSPGHSDAASELRVLEARTRPATPGKASLLDRLKK